MALKKKSVQKEVVAETVAQEEVVVAEEVEQEAVETAVQEEVAEVTQEETAEVVEQEVAVETKNEVAVKESTKVAVKSETAKVGGGNISEFQKEAAEQGFDIDEVGGYGSFPVIVLGSDGKFEAEETDLGDDPIIGQLQSSKNLYMCKQVGVSDSDVAFTSDKINLNSPVEGVTTVEDLKEVWAEQGLELEIKKYKEVLIEGLGRKIDSDGDVIHDDEISGEFYIVKLPPTALSGFDTSLFIGNRKFGGSPSDRVVEFSVGKKRKASNGNTYYPWKIKVVA